MSSLCSSVKSLELVAGPARPSERRCGGGRSGLLEGSRVSGGGSWVGSGFLLGLPERIRHHDKLVIRW